MCWLTVTVGGKRAAGIIAATISYTCIRCTPAAVITAVNAGRASIGWMKCPGRKTRPGHSFEEPARSDPLAGFCEGRFRERFKKLTEAPAPESVEERKKIRR